jgi:PhnB protein
MQLIAYLSFDGNCEEAFRYYEKQLDGKIEAMIPFADAPAGDKNSPGVAPEWKKKIMHASLRVGDAVLMGGDPPPPYYQKPQGVSVSISVDEAGEAERIFNALADGGDVRMPFAETFWAHRFGMCVDRFGTPWMVNCEKAG